MPGLLVGAATVDITPPVGVYLAGFGARSGPSVGVHDRLRGAALVAGDGSRQVAILTVDMVGVPGSLVAEVRQGIAATTGLPAENILISASHTHSGPDIGRQDPLTLAYRAELSARLQEAAAAAWQARRPATIHCGKDVLYSSAKNRRPNGGPIDPEVGVLWAEDGSGKRFAVLVNYTCHGTVLGPDNLLISADYIGYMRAHLAGALGDEPVVLFTNGALGTINPGGYSPEVSMVGGFIPNRTFEHAEQLGTLLASSVAGILAAGAPAEAAVVGSASGRAELPLKERPRPADVQAELQRRRAELTALERVSAGEPELTAARISLAYAQMDVRWAGAPVPASSRLPAEIQAVRLGDSYYVAIPGEPFNEIGTAIKSRSGLPHVFAVGLANDSLGYFPTADAYPVGGYEPTASKVKPGADALIVEQALALLEQVRDG